MPLIVVAAIDGALATSFALSHDILATANRIAVALGRAAPFEVRSLAEPAPVPDCAALVMPGQGLADASQLDALLTTAAAGRWAAMIAHHHAQGGLLVSSCSGVAVLAMAGVLEGRTCTTSWFLAPALKARFPALTLDADAVVVQDGSIITGGAAMAQGDAMLALVSRLAGFEIADLTARYLLLDNRRSQADSRLVGLMVAGEPMLAMAERWARANLQTGFSVDALAAAAGTTARTLARRLARACAMSPMAFINQIRREEAERLLAQGWRFEQAAWAVGYQDASALRRLLMRGNAGARRPFRSRP